MEQKEIANRFPGPFPERVLSQAANCPLCFLRGVFFILIVRASIFVLRFRAEMRSAVEKWKCVLLLPGKIAAARSTTQK
jgi:hypothetical protein